MMRQLKGILLFALLMAIVLTMQACTAYECSACKDSDPNCPVCAVTSGNTGDSENTSDAPTEEITEKPEYFSLTGDAIVVASANNESAVMMQALNAMCDAGERLVGSSLLLSNDWYRGELVRNDVEILIGYTNRPESIRAVESLAYYDYLYEVVSPGCVVICGGGDESTQWAVEKFLLDCYGYEADVSDGALREIPVGTSYVYRHTYETAEVYLGGERLDSFTIVHPDDDAVAYAAFLLRSAVSRVSGARLALSTVEAFDGGNAIYLGCGRDGEHLFTKFDAKHYLLRYESGDCQTVFIDGTTSIKNGGAIRSFAREVLSQVPERGAYDIILPVGDRIFCTELSNEFNDLQFVSAEETVLTDGVRYVKLTYRDGNGAPVIAYAAIADLSNFTVINATPKYSDSATGVCATTPQAMKSAAEAGYTVIAGVNADFFAMGGDNSPTGLCIKQGKVLKVSTSRPWFGITKEGVPVIGTGEQYENFYEGKLMEAVGGSNIILKNGFCNDLAVGGDFGKTRHPRTAVGMTGNNELILLVVDGRQPSISNGASLTDLAYIMQMLGAEEALNLDGGGSSTFVTYTESAGYTVENSPSAGALRYVYNSLVLVKKES